MYDMSKIKIRYFQIKLRNGKVLEIEPPKVKILKKIAALSETQDSNDFKPEDINNLAEAVSLALSKNKQNYKYSAERVLDEFNIEEIIDFLQKYFKWVEDIHNSKN